MKRTALFFIAALTAVFGDYRIEVLRIDANATVPEPFMQRLAAAGYTCSVQREAAHKALLIGPFDDEDAAKEALPFVRCRFADEARVRKLEAVSQATAVAAVDKSREADAVEKPVARNKEEASEACRCLCTKQGMAEYRICKALHFYRCSPDYTFEAR